MLEIYKETKVDVRPAAPKSSFEIFIPSPEDSDRQTKFSILPSTALHEHAIRDEDAFAKRYLATHTSVYFRRRKTYPRSFLWRVVDDDRYLEIRSVDLTKSVNETLEAHLTLRLEFQDRIIPHGVALADPEDHEVLNVFVITRTRHLHTFTLRPEFFRRAASIDENVADWCKVCRPAPLSFAHPHRLHASSPIELFISLESGALVRLTRKAGDDGSRWSLITFDEKPWGASLRGLVRWGSHQSIRYNGRVLDPNTPNAIATSADQAFVFIVGLNHYLKVWNLASHKLVGSTDLLNRTSQQQDASPVMLNPAESAFVRVFNAERATESGEMYYVVTYSPHDDGQFKFWGVKGGLTSQLVIQDLFPNAKLKPADPDPSGNVFWNVADFQIKSTEDGQRMALWVLWRNNTLYQLYSLHFGLSDLEEVWHNNWIGTALEVRHEESPSGFSQSDSVDATERWLEYILSPGRFSSEVLETSLAIYQDAMKSKPVPGISKKPTSLQQRLCSALTGPVSLQKFNDAEMDFARYRREIDTRWRQFWQIAEDISKRRSEAISLAYDAYSDIPWVLLSDGCCLIRECSSTELILHNTGGELQECRRTIEDSWQHRNLDAELGQHCAETARLVELAASFRKKFTPQLSQACRTALDAEIFVEPSSSAPERVAAFGERCRFSELITDDVFDSIYTSIESSVGFAKLSNELFFSVIDTMPLGFPGKDSELLSTDFGRAAVVQGTLETISLNRGILYNLLLLAVFIETELSDDEVANFDGVDLFATLTELLKEYEMMHWLGSNVRVWPEKSLSDGATSLPTSTVSKEVDSNVREFKISTVLEDLFAVHIKPRPAVSAPQTYTLTQQIRDVISWITRQGEVSFPNVLVFIQCDLLACNNIDLASDFLRFQPNTAWSTYVKGRLYVSRSEFDVAAIYFQKAAYLLSYGKAVGNLHEMSSNLLDIISVNSFYDGLPKYLQHILTVFEQARAFAHVADFARLALQALESGPKRSEHENEYIYLRTDLLSRLFHASLKTCHFDEAYSALSQYTDVALQKSALTSLISTILTASGPGTAGLQKVLQFPLSLAPNICSHVDEILASLAKKQTSFPSSTGKLFRSTSRWQDKSNAPDYHRILQAYRVARNDFRGAAEVSYQTVQRLRKARDASGSPAWISGRTDISESPHHVDEDDLESKELRHELLALINLLACMEKSEAYILVDRDEPRHVRSESAITSVDGDSSVFLPGDSTNKSPRVQTLGLVPNDSDNASPLTLGISAANSSAKSPILASPSVAPQQTKAPKRIIVTLEDVRREYQAELDRVSRIESGDWEFGAPQEDTDMKDDEFISDR